MTRHLATSRSIGPKTLAGAVLALSFLAALAKGQVAGETVTYTSGAKQVTVDVLAPAIPGKFPAILLLHGSGGMDQGTTAVFREVAGYLATQGYVVLIPHYFEKTGHVPGKPNRQGEYEAWVEAVKDATDYAATRPEVDPAKFAMIGYSMGSGLATFRATQDPRIKAVASISGAYPPIKPSKKLPPLLILHGSKDKSTPIEYVEKYAAALKEQEMPHAVHVYKNVGHNFNLSQFSDATRRSAAFFDRYVKSPEPPLEKSNPRRAEP